MSGVGAVHSGQPSGQPDGPGGYNERCNRARRRAAGCRRARGGAGIRGWRGLRQRWLTGSQAWGGGMCRDAMAGEAYRRMQLRGRRALSVLLPFWGWGGVV
jgi:hypothetical protein